jgi:uncharacterized protein (TIGR00106 family)
MLALFSTFPTDKGESISDIVAQAIDLIPGSGLDYQVTSMGTLIEGDWEMVMDVIKKCHQKIKEKSKRVYTVITIDDREGAKGRLKAKVASIEKKLGHEVRK